MKPPEAHSSVIHLNYSESAREYFAKSTEKITPPFPNWEKSFVSGHNSPLFEVTHAVDKNKNHTLYTQAVIKDRAEGPPGHAHGGATAGLIDELMGILIWHYQMLGITQSLQLFYWKMVPLNTTMYAVTEVVKISSKKIDVRTTLFDENKTPYVSGEAIFHRLTAEHLELFKKRQSLA